MNTTQSQRKQFLQPFRITYSSPVPKFKLTDIMLLFSYVVGASLNGFVICLIQFPKSCIQKLDLYQFILCLKSVVSVCQPLDVLDAHADKNNIDECAFPSQLRRTSKIAYRSPFILNNFIGLNDLTDENFDYVTFHTYLHLKGRYS